MEIPEKVQRLLWDYTVPADFDDPRWQRSIQGRVKERGGWDEMRWLLRAFSRAQSRAYLEWRGHRVLPPRELRFSSMLCGIPQETADAWVRAARERQRGWRG